jgi:ATP-binding cassette subfamily B protein
MNLLWKYLKNYKKLLILSLVFAAVNQIFSLLDPQIFRLIIDRYATKFQELPRHDFIQGVLFLLFASIGVALVSRIAKNFQDYFVNSITQRLGATMYADSVSHSFSLPYAVFEDQRSGEFLQKLQKAKSDAQLFVASLINTVFLSLIGIIFVLVYAFFAHWMIGSVFLLIIPTLGSFIFWISKKIKAAQKQIIEESAALAGSTTETLRNVELVKGLGLEQQEILRLNNVNNEILRLELKKIKLIRTLSFFQGTMINGLRSLLLFVMLWLIFTKAITLGEFFSLMFYSFAIFNPLGELGNVAAYYQEARASLERLSEIFQIPSQKIPENPVIIQRFDTITFNNVSFFYTSADTEALKAVDVDIKAGETVAFVGPSGSGKTTIVKLLIGLYEPTVGSIKIDKIDMNNIDLHKYRRRIGLVAQETQLFAGTIRENLLFSNPNATDEDCIKVMQSAAAQSLLEKGGQGLDTKIGEGGLKLSGGERQRLSIARALLREPSLLIFDEATSSLDSLTEEQITNTIKVIEKEHKELINILIAHRLSTVMHADKIYVLEKGKIVESGTHGRLIKEGGLYAAMWRQQVASEE